MENNYSKMPQHPEARAAKRIDVTNRLAEGTRFVYRDAGKGTEEERALFREAFRIQPCPPTERQIFFGEMHGHSVLSDGSADPDEYFRSLTQRVDFCALTDHDHGGVDRDTLYTEKWDRIRELTAAHYRPGSFTTLLGVERDSYPWYDNMVIYFSTHTADLPIGAVRGETTAGELAGWLQSPEMFLAPHDTVNRTCTTDFTGRPPELMPHGFEIYSRGDCAEYFDHPLNVYSCIRGGSLQEALAASAHPAVYAGSDDHGGTNALDLPELGFPRRYPGMTGVWAKENTVEGIFEALKRRHTYAFMGPERIYIDFRINGQLMGSRITEEADAPRRIVYYSVRSEVPVKKITVVKNNEDYFVARREGNPVSDFVDYRRQREEDWYYLRVELEDSRMAWTSPIWVKGI